MVHELGELHTPTHNKHGTDVVTQRCFEYMINMFGGTLGGPGEGVYYGQCRKCQYRTRRYRFAAAAETDVQEHLWDVHEVATFKVEVKA